MTFDNLVERIAALPMKEKRAQQANYCEVVVAVGDLPAVTAVLMGYFGAPCKPVGERPSSDVGQLAKNYGGIMAGQTMYSRKDTGAEMAMLWPWGDGQSITVKIIKE